MRAREATLYRPRLISLTSIMSRARFNSISTLIKLNPSGQALCHQRSGVRGPRLCRQLQVCGDVCRLIIDFCRLSFRQIKVEGFGVRWEAEIASMNAYVPSPEEHVEFLATV